MRIVPHMARRSLVLTQENAGHWFRRSLPPHVFEIRSDADEARDNAEAARRWRLGGSDWRGFLTTYCAGFVALSIFIA